MGYDFLRPATSAGAADRVVCGEMIIGNNINVHSETLFAIVRDGFLTVEIDDEAFDLTAGDIYFVSPCCEYRIKNSNGARIDVVLLDLSNPTVLTREFLFQSIIRCLETGNCTHFAKISRGDYRNRPLSDNLDAVITAECEKREYFQLRVYGKMYDIFYILISSGIVKIYDVEAQGKKYRALRKITEYVNNNFCENLTLDSIAHTTGLSRYYISHLFKELMNTTFISYLNDLRLTRASTLLTSTDTPIIEVAGMSGFNNISNFNRAFKMRFKTTPSKYRRASKQKHFAAIDK